MKLVLALAVLGAACVTINAAKLNAPPMFAEWLEQKTVAARPATAKPAAAAAYYQEADYVTACFKQVAKRNCRCIGCIDTCADSGAPSCSASVESGSPPLCCNTAYTEDGLSCCHEEDYGRYQYDTDDSMALPGLGDLEVGTCETTAYYFNLPVPVGSSTVVTKIGTFTKLCNLNSHVDRCGHPFCDSMVLTQTGTIYESTDVVSKTNPTAPTPDTVTCPASSTFPGFDSTGRSGSARKGKSVPAKKASAAEPAYIVPGDRDSYFVGGATIFSGPVTITSRKYDIKYAYGYMDFVSVWTPTSTTGTTTTLVTATADEASEKHEVLPFTYILKIHKPERDEKY